ncbi:MAG: hypothetical protein QOI76_4375 [Frankiales bacterium]|nr:AMP-dependent synthetase and ligase [Frankiales bacterium]MDX6230985.1 hypothetical protein [Frankiales bacterium]
MGERDPAQPLLTLYDGDARVELSGATTANWVAKSANLLVDSFDGPGPVGLLLPLHWQTVALLLAVVTADRTALLVADAHELGRCGVAFVLAEDAEGALDSGVDDVLALSGHPLGAPAGPLPALVLDYAREVPSYGDHFAGPRPAAGRIEVGGRPLKALSGISAEDRLLTTLAPSDRLGAAALVGALQAGASLILVRGGDTAAVAAAERATVTAGTAVPGLTWVA